MDAEARRDDAPPSWRRRLRAIPVFGTGMPGIGADPLPADPMPFAAEWLDEAIRHGVEQPHVAALATADADGAPSVRMLIVKDLDHEGIWFSSSDRSRKGGDLAANPRAALTLYWRELGRQLRFEGTVDAPSAEVSAADFRDRSRTAKRELLAGDPSRPRLDAERRLAEADAVLDADPDAVAPDWVAYRLRPASVEFWAAEPDGPHSRVRYDREVDGRWMRARLWT